MKKKVCLFGIIAFFAATAIFAAANGGMDIIGGMSENSAADEILSTEDLSFAEISEEFALSDEEAVFSAFEKYITESDTDSVSASIIKNRFLETSTNYRMTSAEFAQIKPLMEEGCDIELLLDIYEFLRGTNSGAEMIRDIYFAGVQSSEEPFWIYETYDKLMGRSDDMLNVGDVADFVSAGLTAEEIAGAYYLSFAGGKTTKEMLEARLSGETWNSIAAEALSEEGIFDNCGELDIGEILYFRETAVRQRRPVSEVIQIEDGTADLSEAALDENAKVRGIKESVISSHGVLLPSSDEGGAAYDSDDMSGFTSYDPDEFSAEEYAYTEEDEIATEGE